MREFVATVKIREYSGLSIHEAQERIRRQVSGLLTGNLEVAHVEVRPRELDDPLEMVAALVVKAEEAAQECKRVLKEVKALRGPVYLLTWRLGLDRVDVRR